MAIITITGSHGSGKDTVINGLLQQIIDSKKVVAYTDRDIRNNEIDGYTYHFVDDLPPAQELYDHVSVAAFNTKTNSNSINYWIPKKEVSNILQNTSNTYLRNTAPGLVRKLKNIPNDGVFSVYLRTDTSVLIDRLMKRDQLDEDAAIRRLLHDPSNHLRIGSDEKLFDLIINNTNQGIQETIGYILSEINIGNTPFH